jgi:signal transduction histidine kinase/ligand-binding sensor domain-containing protein
MNKGRIRPFPAILLALGLTFLLSRPLLAQESGAVVNQLARPPHQSWSGSSLLSAAPAFEEPPPSAQSQLKFERITTADGLSFPIVRDILQDQQGFLWFATDSGLNRYDGYEFTVYKEDLGDPTTIRFDDAYVLFEDSEGTLWIGGGGGLDRFDRTTQTFTHVDTRGQVFTIYEDSAGTLWVGFWHGLYGYDRATGEIRHDDQPNPEVPDQWSARTESAVQAIYEDRQGSLWIGTSAGLYRRDSATGVFTACQHDPQDPASVSSDAITVIYEDRQGTLWIGTATGLDQFDPASGAFHHFRHDPADPESLSDDLVLSLLQDSDGTLWIGTRGGLDRFDPAQGRFLHHRHDPENPHSVNGDLILSLLEDRSGLLWVGTADGASRSDRRGDQFTHYQQHRDPPDAPSYTLDVSALLREPQPAILSDSKILSLHEDSAGVLWIGTLNGGLNRLDRRSGHLTVYRHDPADLTSLSSNTVTAIFQDRAGVLWIGTADGWLEQFDSHAGSFVHFRQMGAEVGAIVEDLAGNLWIGTAGESLSRLDGDRLSLEHFPHIWREPDHWSRFGTLSSHIVSALSIDRAGVLWVGTGYGGVNLWGEAEGRFTHLRHDPADPNSLSHDQVLSILEDPAGDSVWIGTGGGGLNRYDRATRNFTRYGEADGLAGDTVGCILAGDSGVLWLGTIRGLSRFDPRAGIFRNYDRWDGIGVLSAGLAAPGSCLQSEDGEILFGGSDGLYAFRPEQLPENLHPPPLAITALKVLEETVYRDLSPDQHIRLSYQDNFLSFDFAALDYTMPEKNQYAYQMEGLDRDWVYAGTRRYAAYPDLKPGEYIFRVKGSNSDGIWNDERVAVRITVEPPLWDTWIFRVAVALVLVLAAVGIYRQRVRSIQVRSQELERQVEERTREIQQLSEKAQELAVMEERQRLARDLHDAVSQTLFSASLIAESLPELWQASPDEAQELLLKLQQLSRGALAEMRALLIELRPAALAEASMRELLRQLGQAVSGREGIPVRVTVEDACDSHAPDLPTSVHIALYRIAQESLNNVVKHAQASQVDISLRCTSTPQEARVELCIRDDGLGFDPDTVTQDRLGLGIMHERAESIGAQLQIESQPAHGTRVTVVWTGVGGDLHG